MPTVLEHGERGLNIKAFYELFYLSLFRIGAEVFFIFLILQPAVLFFRPSPNVSVFSANNLFHDRLLFYNGFQVE